jgi:hypothetical protein
VALARWPRFGRPPLAVALPVTNVDDPRSKMTALSVLAIYA